VLVTRNDYALGLMNGDMGITLTLPGNESDSVERPLRVAFRTGDGKDGIKWVLPSRLQAVETVYALTVHKSQGSEFAHAALVLPDKLNPILTRAALHRHHAGEDAAGAGESWDDSWSVRSREGCRGRAGCSRGRDR
jgi:exodeoxyribonuclease V alpha subunit